MTTAPQTERAIDKARDASQHQQDRDDMRHVGHKLEGQRQQRITAETGEWTHPSLAAALVAFQVELPRITKAQRATIPGRDGRSGYSYTYAGLPDVSDAVTPVLTKHGLAFTCSPRQVPGTGAYELVGVLTHQGGETMEGALPIQGRDAQTIGSAMTYMRRYLLCAMTGVVADDDDDGQRAQAAQGPVQVDRTPEAAALWAKAQESTSLADVQAVWREAGAAGLMEVDVEHLDGGTEPLGIALRRYGDSLASDAS